MSMQKKARFSSSLVGAASRLQQEDLLTSYDGPDLKITFTKERTCAKVHLSSMVCRQSNILQKMYLQPTKVLGPIGTQTDNL